MKLACFSIMGEAWILPSVFLNMTILCLYGHVSQLYAGCETRIPSLQTIE